MEIQNKNKINGTKTNSLVEAIITLVSNYFNYGSFGKHYLKPLIISPQIQLSFQSVPFLWSKISATYGAE